MIVYAKWVEEQKDALNRLSKGAKISELAMEYGISQTVMSAHVDKLIEMQDLLKKNELYRSMWQSEVVVDAKQAKRIINGFKRCNVTTIEGVRGMSKEQICKIRNFGARVVDIIEDLGWIEKSDQKLKYVSHCKSAAIIYSKLFKAGATKEELELYSNLLEKYNINRYAYCTLVEKGERG